MNYGPLVFLAAFFALATSWFGLVLTPVMQVGHLQQTNTVGIATTYPLGRPGLAREGLDVYRANGCASCHSQQIGQTETLCDVLLTETGTNGGALAAALLKINALSQTSSSTALQLPLTVVRGVSHEQAVADIKTINAAGAKAQMWLIPGGPDIARGWGMRRTVAEDFLFDSPVMLGTQRIGPDLANIGARQPDPNWHLLHLYAPRTKEPASTMAPYRFLFETRKIERAPAPDALVLPPDWPKKLTPAPGYEIVPKLEAKALAAYLVSLRADAALFVTPMSVASAPEATNAPTAGMAGTNSPATNSVSK